MKKIRVLIAKPGLDGHDRGAKVVAQALRAAGMEVIYTGLHQSVDQIAQTALQEDVDVVGVSIYSGAHLYFGEKLMAKLREEKLEDRLVIFGGNIPNRDILALKEFGVTEVFPTGAKFEDIAKYIEDNVKRGE
ncbi:MAG: cobalamin B12-binding domain-containing protein [Thermoplasmata archaeon]|nr:MAG: cobalamin B12-binding domain-containing protein [Thermoplasmata archaeon]